MSKYTLNLLGLPKNKEFMRVFKAPPGYKLVQADISSLEPHVLAQLSQDPMLMKVYGPGASPHHDIYFVAGMKIPGIQDSILQYYDIDNPTEDGIKYLQENYGSVRSKVLKPAYLGWIFGLGKETMSINLDITEFEAHTILRGMDKQFAGRDKLKRRLLSQWSKNGGYVINGRGVPICIDFQKTKDVVNRVVQSTGVQILGRIIFHMNNYRKEHKVKALPYIPNFHDESVWLAKDGYEDEVIDMFKYGIDRINDELNWDVIIKWGGVNVGTDLSIRCD